MSSKLRIFQEVAFLLQQVPNTHLWLIPKPLVAVHRLCSFHSSMILLVLSLSCMASTQEMQGLPMIIQQFPLVESYLCFCGHFSILALTLSLVSEISVPHSLVHLHSLLWMSLASSIDPLNKWSSFVAGLRYEVMTTPFSSAPLLSRYIAAEGRSEVFPPCWIPRHLQ